MITFLEKLWLRDYDLPWHDIFLAIMQEIKVMAFISTTQCQNSEKCLDGNAFLSSNCHPSLKTPLPLKAQPVYFCTEFKSNWESAFRFQVLLNGNSWWQHNWSPTIWFLKSLKEKILEANVCYICIMHDIEWHFFQRAMNFLDYQFKMITYFSRLWNTLQVNERKLRHIFSVKQKYQIHHTGHSRQEYLLLVNVPN